MDLTRRSTRTTIVRRRRRPRPRSPTAEAEDLKSLQCGFKSHRGHNIRSKASRRASLRCRKFSNPRIHRNLIGFCGTASLLFANASHGHAARLLRRSLRTTLQLQMGARDGARGRIGMSQTATTTTDAREREIERLIAALHRQIEDGISPQTLRHLTQELERRTLAERRCAELFESEQLARAAALESQQANEAKDRFLAMLSHE